MHASSLCPPRLRSLLAATTLVLAGCPSPEGDPPPASVDTEAPTDTSSTGSGSADVDGSGTDPGSSSGSGSDSTGVDEPATPSAGCGTPPTETGTVELTLEVDGIDREVWLKIPGSYTGEDPLPLFFNWHGAGNSAMQATTWLGVPSPGASTALHVYPQGLGDPAGWSDQDLALFDTLAQHMADEYCVDLAKLYSIGYSAGGGFSNFLACHRGQYLAGMALVAFGFGYPEDYFASIECPSVPSLFLYGLTDSWAGYSDESRDWLLETNGCTDESTRLEDPNLPETMVCDDYSDCEDPVRICYHFGGHEWPSTPAQTVIWGFFDP
ncbi:MAG: hypothetical protein AAF799_18345 [Myxococcota bacterium]